MKIEHYMYQNYKQHKKQIAESLQHSDKVFEILKCIMDGCKGYGYALPLISSVEGYETCVVHRQKRFDFIKIGIEVESLNDLNACYNFVALKYDSVVWLDESPPATYVCKSATPLGLNIYFKISKSEV